MEIKELDKPEQALATEENNKTSTGSSVAKRKRGRPPGAKNKNTVFKELMQGEFQSTSEKEVKAVLEVLFKKAKAGDMKAIKLVMDRLVAPARSEDEKKERGGISVNITVGSMEQAKGIQIEDADYEVIE